MGVRWGAAVGLVVAVLAGARAEAADLRATLEKLFSAADPGPPVARLVHLDLGAEAAIIGLELPKSVPLHDLPADVENRLEQAAGAIAALRPEIRAIHLGVRHPGEALRPPPRRPSSPPKAPRPVEHVIRDPSRFPFGQSLRGRTIALSPGHGYIWYDNLGRYSTQRGNIRWQNCGPCRGITEDFETHEVVIRFLIPLLEGAGAKVILVRDRSYSGAGQIADDGGSQFGVLQGTFAPGANEGGHAGGYQFSTHADAAVEWRLNAAVSGPQLLSMWFVAGDNRHPDGRLEVWLPGSVHPFLVDMTSHGRRWAPVGLFDLEAGEAVTVRLSAPPSAAGSVLIADAVRLGGGSHSTGHAWWRMGARPFAEHQEAPAGVRNLGDVGIRPAYAEWYGADIYVSVHSNASGQSESTAAGTSTYRYNCGTLPDHSAAPPASQCDDPPGSDRLTRLVHQGLVDQVRADWDPAWIDRGTRVANFGEVRGLAGIPGTLMEIAFHDNVRLPAGSSLRMTDNQALHDPRWRRAAAYGVYSGISRFFDPNAPLLPGTTEALVARRHGPTAVRLDFAPVPGALGYRVYAAAGGRTFDAGQLVEAPPVLLEDLPEDSAVALKVAALNAAGEGLSSPVVVARTSRRPAQLLVVDAFEREDAWVQEIDNRRDTALTAGLAVAGGSEVAFDGCTEAALRSGLASLEGYDALLFALGRESTEHGVLTADLRTAVRQRVAAGAAVFAAGSEIGWTLDARGDDESRGFLGEVFGAAFAQDDATVNRLVSAPGGWLAQVAPAPGFVLAGPGEGLLETRSPDVFLARDGEVELYYGDTGEPAAVRRERGLVLGAALDNLREPQARAAVVGAWLEQAVILAPPEEPPPPPDAGVMEPDAGAPLPDAGLLEDAGVTPPDAGLEPLPDAGEEAPRGLRAVTPRPIRGGCQCAPSGAAPSLLVALGLLALLTRRRR